MACFKYVTVITLHKGDNKDNNKDNNNNNNNGATPVLIRIINVTDQDYTSFPSIKEVTQDVGASSVT
jgi:hypothetical protein